MSTLFQAQFHTAIWSFISSHKWSEWNGLPNLQAVFEQHSPTLCERDFLYVQTLLSSLHPIHMIELDLLVHDDQMRRVLHLTLNWKLNEDDNSSNDILHPSDAFLPKRSREYSVSFSNNYMKYGLIPAIMHANTALLSPYTYEEYDNSLIFYVNLDNIFVNNNIIDDANDVVVDNDDVDDEDANREDVDDDVSDDDLPDLIRFYESELLRIYRPLPPLSDFENLRQYLKYLKFQIVCFDGFQSVVPLFLVALDDQCGDKCSLCQYPIVVGQDISSFMCGHFQHSNCLLTYLEGTRGNKCCPLCRHTRITLYV